MVTFENYVPNQSNIIGVYDDTGNLLGCVDVKLEAKRQELYKHQTAQAVKEYIIGKNRYQDMIDALDKYNQQPYLEPKINGLPRKRVCPF